VFELSGGRHSRRQNLGRDFPVQLRVLSAVDLAHAARAEWREDFVWTEFRASSQRHRYSRFRINRRTESIMRQDLGVASNRWRSQQQREHIGFPALTRTHRRIHDDLI